MMFWQRTSHFKKEGSKQSKTHPRNLHFFAIAITLTSFIGLSACAQNQNTNPNLNPSSNTADFGEVVATWPAHNETNIVRDPTIRIVFSEALDAASAFDFNYQIWGFSDGVSEHVGAEKVMGSQLVPHPNDPNKKVTEITIRLRDHLLSPGMTYTVTWAGNSSSVNLDSDIPPALIGLMTVNNTPVTPGGFSFQVGTGVSAMESGGTGFRVLSSSPGQMFSRGTKVDFFGSLSSAFNPLSNRNTIVTNSRAPIRVHLSNRIGHIGGIDNLNIPESQLPELRNIPLQSFPYMVVGLFDQNTNFSLLFSQASLDLGNINQLYNNRIEGRVSTENNRRTIVFRPTEDYPDELLKYVIYMVGGFNGQNNSGELPDFVTMGSFVHSSGYQTELPWLNNAFQNLIPDPSNQDGEGA
jgi:hypothetical protein